MNHNHVLPGGIFARKLFFAEPRLLPAGGVLPPAAESPARRVCSPVEAITHILRPGAGLIQAGFTQD
jgi:hypothetical protein